MYVRVYGPFNLYLRQTQSVIMIYTHAQAIVVAVTSSFYSKDEQ